MPRRRHAVVTAAALAAAAILACAPAHAVLVNVTNNTGSSNYTLLLRVGSAAGVDQVNFNVTGNNVALNQTPVTGAPNINVSVQPLRPNSTWILPDTATRPTTLTVNSSAGLACQSGPCGTTVIPFNQISWTASNNSAGGDIQSGTFNGSAGQQIASFNANTSTCSLLNLFLVCIGTWDYETQQLQGTTMKFTYANNTIYPAGTYKGTVTFTATMQ